MFFVCSSVQNGTDVTFTCQFGNYEVINWFVRYLGNPGYGSFTDTRPIGDPTLPGCRRGQPGAAAVSCLDPRNREYARAAANRTASTFTLFNVDGYETIKCNRKYADNSADEDEIFTILMYSK